MFGNHELSRHAAIRMRQRGMRDDDLRWLLEIASQISPDAYMLTEHDATREIAKRKHEIQRLERLKGCKVVVEAGAVVTCYHARSANQKKTFRRGRGCNDFD